MSTVDQHQPETADASSDSLMIPIGEILLAIWERRRLILIATGVGLLLGLAVSIRMRNEYTSNAQLMPPDAQSLSPVSVLGVLNGTNLPGLAGGSLMGQRTPGATVIGILSSDTIQNRIIDSLNLRSEYQVKLYMDARGALIKNTVLNEDKKTGMVTIAVTDPDPKRARDIAQAYVDQLNAVLNTLNTSSAHRERVFLEDRLQSLKEDLDKSSVALSRFSSSTATVNPQGQGQALIESVAHLQQELVTAQSELSALKAEYGPENVRVRSAQARVDELSGALHQMSGTDRSANGESPTQSGQVYPSLRELPLLGVTYTDLARRLATEEGIYDTLTKQYELAKVDEAKELPVAKVLDSPDIPERKSSPHRGLITLGTAIVAGFLAMLYVIVGRGWELVPEEAALKVLLAKLRKYKAQTSTIADLSK